MFCCIDKVYNCIDKMYGKGNCIQNICENQYAFSLYDQNSPKVKFDSKAMNYMYLIN